MTNYLIQIHEQAEAVGRQIVADRFSEREIAKLIVGIFGGRVESLAKENVRLSESVIELSATNAAQAKALIEAGEVHEKDSRYLVVVRAFLNSFRAVQELL